MLQSSGILYSFSAGCMPSRRDPPCSTGCRARTAGRRNSSVHVISIQTIQYLHEPRVYQHCLWRKTHWHWPLSRFLQRCRQTSQSPLCWPGTGQSAVVVTRTPSAATELSTRRQHCYRPITCLPGAGIRPPRSCSNWCVTEFAVLVPTHVWRRRRW